MGVESAVRRVSGSVIRYSLPSLPDVLFACVSMSDHILNVGGGPNLSLTASCHLCNLAISFTWKPKILGRYLSAFNATAAVLVTSLPTVSPVPLSSLPLLGRLPPFPALSVFSGAPPLNPGPSIGPLFVGISAG